MSIYQSNPVGTCHVVVIDKEKVYGHKINEYACPQGLCNTEDGLYYLCKYDEDIEVGRFYDIVNHKVIGEVLIRRK